MFWGLFAPQGANIDSRTVRANDGGGKLESYRDDVSHRARYDQRYDKHFVSKEQATTRIQLVVTNMLTSCF